MSITVDNLEEVFNRIPDGPKRERALTFIIDRGRFVIQRNVMADMPSLTGVSRRNVTTEANGLSGRVTVNGGAAFADEGTSPHPIYPRLAQVLRFVPLGGRNPAARFTGRARRGQESVYVFAYAVNHPGQAGQHYMRQAVDDSLMDLHHLAETALEKMLSA